MNNIYIIRHAESEANKARIMASQLPYPLTKEGKEDSKLIAKELKEIVDIDVIISSSLLRATQTASSFSELYGLDITEDDRIIEQHLGKYSGMTYDEVKLEPNYETITLNRWNWTPEDGGESYSDIARRVEDFFTDLNNKYENKNILIVTHAVVFRLIGALLKNTLPQYPEKFPNNGEIWHAKFNGLGTVYTIDSIMLGNSKKFIHNP